MNTILPAGVGLKLVPVIVIAEPTGPAAGEKELMVGWAKLLTEINTKSKKNIYLFCSGLGAAGVEWFMR